MSELTLTPPASLPLVGSARAALSDARTLIGRGVRLTWRNVDGIFLALALPVILMLLFVYLFGGALQGGGHYVDYVLPGVLLVCVSFGASTTAVSVSDDLSGGIIDRFRSLDVRGEVFISGHVVASVLRNLISTSLVFGVAFAIGYRSPGSLGQWLGALGILVLFLLALSWLSAALGILARSPEAANGLTFLIAFIPYASSAFVRVQTMPWWLRPVANNQPETAVANTIRGLLDGQAVGSDPWHAVAWSLGIMTLSVAAAGVLFRRRTH